MNQETSTLNFLMFRSLTNKQKFMICQVNAKGFPFDIYMDALDFEDGCAMMDTLAQREEQLELAPF